MRYVLTLLMVFCLAGPAIGQTLGQAQDLINQGNYEEAAEILGVLADAGDAHAQNNLGVLHQFGLGVQKNNARALELFGKAGQAGDHVLKRKAETNRLKLLYEETRDQM